MKNAAQLSRHRQMRHSRALIRSRLWCGVVRLLMPENRALLAMIRDRKPQSVAELVKISGRAQPNLTRTLAKLEAAGFITMTALARRKTPSVAVKKIVVAIDPCSERDQLRVA
jgi:predicted transcriptional regulator